LEATEYKFLCAPKNVIPTSVTISGLEYGEDFHIYYSTANRGPILVDDSATLTVESTVSYEYTYQKHTELDLPLERQSGRIIRA